MVRRLRLLLLVASRQAGKGGRETAVEKVCGELARRGHVVHAALMGPSVDRSWEARLPAVSIGPLPTDWHSVQERILPSLRFAAGTLRTERPDVAIVTEPAGAALLRGASLLAGVPRVPTVSWLHGDVSAIHHSWALRLCDGHLAISAGIADQIRRLSAAPVRVVHNPVDLPDDLCPRPGDAADRRFAFIGRLEGQKRVDRLLESLSRLKARNWRLEIIGDGSLRPQLERLAGEVGVAERVVWRGWVDDPWTTAGSVSGLLLTSDSEGFPMVLIEAIARGVPLISMDCDFGPREVIRDGENGWLTPFGDTDAFAAVLEEICRGSRPLPLPETVRATAQVYDTRWVVDAIEETLLAVRRD